ncbi:MAG: deoxyribonuclease IV, partial [Candidatus Bathyarchaeota archaeon]|nr:deoxyribonuclease IV [Candidatus Bathyarchaeota archaeon]
MVRLGFHVSITGGIDRAVDRARGLGCDTFQIFTRNPRSWASRALERDEVGAFRVKRAEAGMDPVFGHMPYVLNLASPEDGVYLRSLESLSLELGRCSALGVPMLVTHIGSHLGSGPERGVSRVVDGVRSVLKGDGTGVRVLLENGPGSKNSVGSGFDELRLVLDGIDRPDRVAVCLDTCHAFAAGYDLRSEEGLGAAVEAFDVLIGLERLMLVHLNDSVAGLGRGVDHHEHIGLGE